MSKDNPWGIDKFVALELKNFTLLMPKEKQKEFYPFADKMPTEFWAQQNIDWCNPEEPYEYELRVCHFNPFNDRPSFEFVSLEEMMESEKRVNAFDKFCDEAQKVSPETMQIIITS